MDRRAYDTFCHEPATNEVTEYVRLVAEEFPWAIDICVRVEKGVRAVTCGDVWRGIHYALQEPLSQSEWAILMSNKDASPAWGERFRNVVQGMRTREPVIPRRVDWLGNKTVFCGLKSGGDLARRVLRPGTKPCRHTYLVTFKKVPSS
ncbi:hypothetical protein SCHPADRAFT_191012 [Schizopora paradoxa]|uniref:DUF6699 domain-containing protein n=1 Tax=Schizopora paradoxa TaxID=27342 RepID=A0A0H2RXY3_9AGAM|nr:hypothetical protein SCHPADRAFT_191012 [Schizopora paradoxa]